MEIDDEIPLKSLSPAQSRREVALPIMGLLWFVLVIPVGLMNPDLGGELWLMYLCGAPYFAMGLIYSQPAPPQSIALWTFLFVAGFTTYCFFGAILLFGRKELGTRDILLPTLLTALAMSQIRLLIRVRQNIATKHVN